MQPAVKLNIVISADRRVEITLPHDVPLGPAEVIVLFSPEPAGERKLRPIGIDEGQGWIADDFDTPLPDDIQQLFEEK